MKALVIHEHGPLENLTLTQVADPVPQPGQVLVDVKAASVNFPDLLVIGGTYQNLPARPFSPGKDLAGVVAAVGAGVTEFKPGDRVCAQVEFGAYADDHHDRNELGHFARQRAREKHGIEFAPERIFVLGDTPHDISCARAIGAKAVAIATGKFSAAELEVFKPDYLFSDLGDVPAVLEIFG